MTMTPLPPSPSSKDPTSFDDRADELLAVALPRFVEEANALALDVSTKQDTASAAAVTATGQAGIATTKAGEAGDHASAANSSKEAAAASALSALTRMQYAEEAATQANTSKLAAAESAATIDPQALSSDYAGPDEPPVIWPYMTWADTATLTKKRRNAANSAWVIEGRLFRSHLPIIPLGEIPTTDIGQISVITIGIMEWDGAAYAALTGGTAADISYDNAESGLAAEDVQAAIDETLGVAQTFSANDPRVRTATNAPGDAPIFACRAWVNFNGTGVVAIRASGNVSSITDNEVGDYTVNLATPMQDENYSVIPAGRNANSVGLNSGYASGVSIDVLSASSFRCFHSNITNSGSAASIITAADTGIFCASIFR